MPDSEYYLKNAEKYKEASRQYRIKNKTYVSDYNKKWRIKNRKRIAAYNKYHYWKNRPWHIERWKKWAAGKFNLRKKYIHLPKYRFSYSVNTAKRRGLEWAIDFSNYCEFLKRRCFYCDSQLSSTAIGLDRIDNSKGYLISNVLPCCGPCNKMRGDYITSEEMKVAMDAIRKFRLSKLTEGVLS